MKEVWMCQWETIPGDGEHLEKFPTFAEAKKAMRQKISQCMDLSEYLADLDPNAANYLRNYLSDPDFPYRKEDAPEDYEEPEHGELILDANYISWDYPYDAYPRLHTDLVLDDGDKGEFEFHFWYEHLEKAPENGAKGMSIRIYSEIDYGTSAYPLMILRVLSDTPKTQDQIIQSIWEWYDKKIDRKAVGRHLKLLQDMGFPVQHSPEGYYISSEFREPEQNIKYGTSAYPLMVSQVLGKTPQTKTAIIHAVQQKYGTKIDRKAVGRHLELLDALGYNIQKCEDGYFITE